MKENEKKLPMELYKQIADQRVFALGYSTKEIIQQLKQISRKNEIKVKQRLVDFSAAQQVENIPENIRTQFGFYDCKVLSVEKKKDIIILFDSSRGFTEDNRLIFHDAKIIQEDKAIDACWWIYEELYKTIDGYEAHMMFADETNSFIELTIVAKDITVDKV